MPTPVSRTAKETASRAGGEHAQTDLAALRELQGVRQQVLQDLAETLRIGLEGEPERRARSTVANVRFFSAAAGSNSLASGSMTSRRG